jgi:hypothetical protein
MSGPTLPALLSIPWANTGPKNTIPNTVPPLPGNATWDGGFPPVTMIPIASGGIPPYGADMNGGLFAISAHTVWQNAGGNYVFNTALATALGGYNVGAVLQRADGTGYWLNLVAANVNDPDGATPAGWVPLDNYGITALTGLTNANVILSLGQASKPIITVAGALTGNVQIVVPAILGQWLVVNNTTGSFTVTVKTAAGTGVIIPQLGVSAPTSVWGDGTNINNAVAPPVPVVPATTTIAVTNANVVLSPAQYANPVIEVTGVLTAQVALIFPPLIQQWVIVNNTTGNFPLNAKTVSGNLLILPTIPQTGAVYPSLIITDGTDVVVVSQPPQHATASGVTGGTITLTPAVYSANVIQIVGALTSNLIVQFPANQGGREWTISNSTTGNFTVSIRTVGGSVLTQIPQYPPNIKSGVRVYQDIPGVEMQPGFFAGETSPTTQLAIAGLTGGTRTLTQTEAQNTNVTLTGALTSNLILVFPNTVPGVWNVNNATTGAFTVTAQSTLGVNTVPCPRAFNNGTGTQVWVAAAAGDLFLRTENAGRYLGQQIFVANGTYTPSVGCTRAVVELMGGGGGGGGTPVSTGSFCASPSGGGGCYARKTINNPTPTAISIGAAGTSGTGAGGNGGTTSFGGVFSALGGAGGAVGTAGNIYATAGGAGGAVSAGSDISFTGDPGGMTLVMSAAVIAGGNGGSGLNGAGAGRGAAGTNNGGPANTNSGGGGGGSCSVNSGTTVGGAGAAGICIITEYS